MALRALAKRLPAHLLGEAIRTATESITDERYKAASLAALAPHLSDSQLGDAVEAAQGITDESCRAEALTVILANTPLSQRTAILAEALQATQSIGDPSSQANTLAELAPYLPETQRAAILASALQAAQAIGDPRPQADTIAKLGPHLTESQLHSALDAAEAIRDPEAQSAALAALVPFLPGTRGMDVFAVALRAIQAISDESVRAAMLQDLVPHLPDGLIGDALGVAETINNRWDRPRAFQALIPRIADAGRLDAIRHALRGIDRHAALQMIGLFAPLIAAEGGHEMAGMVARSIEQIVGWWP